MKPQFVKLEYYTIHYPPLKDLLIPLIKSIGWNYNNDDIRNFFKDRVIEYQVIIDGFFDKHNNFHSIIEFNLYNKMEYLIDVDPLSWNYFRRYKGHWVYQLKKYSYINPSGTKTTARLYGVVD